MHLAGREPAAGRPRNREEHERDEYRDREELDSLDFLCRETGSLARLLQRERALRRPARSASSSSVHIYIFRFSSLLCRCRQNVLCELVGRRHTRSTQEHPLRTRIRTRRWGHLLLFAV